MDKARTNEHMDVTHCQIDKMKAAAEENGNPICARCLSWKEETCTRGVTRLVPGEIIRCALFHEKTHGDEIRGMTDEELAKLLSSKICPPKKKCQGAECFGCWLHYLLSPVGGEG